MHREHRFAANVKWTGNLGQGTAGYKTFGRNHEIAGAGKPMIPGSSDPLFRGDGSRYNPEELMVASLSTCHMLWYLHLCSDAGVVVTAYEDAADGIMLETENGSGAFTEATLRPRVTVKPGSDVALAMKLHHTAHGMCFIANSVKFPVKHEATVVEEG
jgi:organic hydroperoxide reductase OsmC/OhrA